MISTMALSQHLASLSASDTTTILSVLAGIIVALIAVAGALGAWGALKVARNSATLGNYKSSAESWEALAKGLEAEKSLLEGRLDGAMGTITTLEAKVTTLQELATGHPAMERLGRDMKRSFTELTTQMTRIEDSLKGTLNGGHGGGGSPATSGQQP